MAWIEVKAGKGRVGKETPLVYPCKMCDEDCFFELTGGISRCPHCGAEVASKYAHHFARVFRALFCALMIGVPAICVEYFYFKQAPYPAAGFMVLAFAALLYHQELAVWVTHEIFLAIMFIFASLIAALWFSVLYQALGRIVGFPPANPRMAVALGGGLFYLYFVSLKKARIKGATTSRILIGSACAVGMTIPVFVVEMMVSPDTSPWVGALLLAVVSAILICRAQWSLIVLPCLRRIYTFSIAATLICITLYFAATDLLLAGHWRDPTTLLAIAVATFFVVGTVAAIIVMSRRRRKKVP